MNLIHLRAMLNNVSLSAIRAFEAAARRGSFKAAASELGLSPSAVSHAVAKLERMLGRSLYERAARTMHLTSDGEILLQHATLAFEELRRGIELVSSHRSSLLRIHSAPSFAAQILLPRLPAFLAANPGIEVRIAASTEYVRFVDETFDADVVYGVPRGADDLVTVPLGLETVTPLCSPELARTIGEPEDLLRHVLIRSDNKQIRWMDWCAANGLDGRSSHAMSFDRSFLAIAAAADGLGVALESTRLAHRELAGGRLIAPFLGRGRDIHYIGHYLVYPRTGAQRRLSRRFAEWLLGELGEPLLDDCPAPSAASPLHTSRPR